LRWFLGLIFGIAMLPSTWITVVTRKQASWERTIHVNIGGKAIQLSAWQRQIAVAQNGLW
jgi:hypothetical protein